MKERIKELVKQAREYATTRHPVSNIVLSVNSEKFEEKFAALIVGESMAIAQEYDGAKLGGPGLIIAMRIEQHFGVEE